MIPQTDNPGQKKDRPLSAPESKKEPVFNFEVKPTKNSVLRISLSKKGAKVTPLFGIELSEMWRLQKEKYPGDESLNDKPWVLKVLAERIVSLNGMGTLGIFRISGDCEDVQRCKKALNDWKPHKA